MRTLLMLLALVVIGLIPAGCATMEDESDLPWNTPQSWEGSPSIPGMNQY
jgi:hypothetical protein